MSLFAASALAKADLTAFTAPDQSKPRIVADDKNNAVRILIGGREVLTVDAKGLHVNGAITYSGPLTATGAPRTEPRK